MGGVSVCDECAGAGVHGYQSGPAVERCPRCGGAGLLFSDDRTALRDLARSIASGQGAELLFALGEGGLARAVAVKAAELEARLADVELEIAKRL